MPTNASSVPTKPFVLAGTVRRFSRLSPQPGRLGQPANDLFVVLDGLIGRVFPSAGSATTLIDIAGPGTVLADGLVAPFTWRSDLIPLHRAKVTAVPIGIAQDIISAHPRILVSLLAEAYATQQRLAETIAEHNELSAEQRIFSQLVRLTERIGPAAGHEEPTMVPLTMHMLGSAAGTTRQTVSAVLSRAAAAGLVQLGRGQIRVLRPTEMRSQIRSTAAQPLQPAHPTAPTPTLYQRKHYA